MEGSFLRASSFQPRAATRATGRYAPWVLLDSKAYFAVHENATTAEAVTSIGRTIKVTFCLADPPAISHFCVHGPEFQRGDFTTEPLVLFSAKDLVLFRFCFAVGPWSTHCLSEYFVYKAGRGKPPSLTPIPHTPASAINSFLICILPFDHDDDEGFVLADLFMTMHRTDYQLQVFSSKIARWTTTPLQLQASPGVGEEDLPRGPRPFLDKVIVLGGGVVGWVDLYRGIVSCNVFDKNPILSFIPIPTLGECTEQRLTHDPRPARYVTCRNGFIKFVKLDLRSKQEGPNTSVCNGWKLRTWYRHTSWDYWQQDHNVDVDDISTDSLDSGTGLPLWLWCQQTPTLWDAESGTWALGNMLTGYPILGIDNDDVVYLMSMAAFVDKNAWMLGVDLATKTVEVLQQVSTEGLTYFNPKFLTFNRAPNEAQDYHFSVDNIAESSLPPQHGNNSCYNGSFYDRSHTAHPAYFNYQHPPTWSANSPQPLHTNLTSQGSGYIYLANSQSMDLVADTDSEVWFSLPMGPTEPPRPCDSTRLYRFF